MKIIKKIGKVLVPRLYSTIFSKISFFIIEYFSCYSFFKFFRFVHYFFVRLFRINSVEIEGNKIFIDDKDSLGLVLFRKYEEFLSDFIKKEVKENDIVLDIGANIGYYSLLFSRLVKEKGMVYSFEPEPNNFNLLIKNIKYNNLTNVKAFQYAISDKDTIEWLYLSDYNNGDHRIFQSDEKRKKIAIETKRIDTLINDGVILKPSFIKMDIQGSEMKAINGMENFLQNTFCLRIVLEFWPRGLIMAGTDPLSFLNKLMLFNFCIYEIEEKKKRIERKNIDDLLRKYTFAKNNYTNLLCVKI